DGYQQRYFGILLIKPTQSGHICRSSKLPDEARHQKKIGFDDDVMYEVEYQTRKCQFGEQSQTTDYKSKVADDQVRENTAEIIFDDGSEGPGQYGHNTDAHEQKLDGVIRHKDQGKHPQKPVYSHLGQQAAKHRSYSRGRSVIRRRQPEI